MQRGRRPLTPAADQSLCSTRGATHDAAHRASTCASASVAHQRDNNKHFYTRLQRIQGLSVRAQAGAIRSLNMRNKGVRMSPRRSILEPFGTFLAKNQAVVRATSADHPFSPDFETHTKMAHELPVFGFQSGVKVGSLCDDSRSQAAVSRPEFV